MGRLPRFVIVGHPQHVIVRGNNREPIFYADEDYQFYLDNLQQACGMYECHLHAYVLMTNHVHLLITPQIKAGISKAMQSVGRCYVQKFNYRYGRTGTLWEGRYRASLIDSDHYALTCYRYIELNPVRAGMVDHPAEYPWSSYRHNALGELNELLVPHATYRSLGRVSETRQMAYRSLFNQSIDDKTVAEIRAAANHAWVLGSGYFKEMIEKQLTLAARPRARGGDRRSMAFRSKGKIDRV